MRFFPQSDELADVFTTESQTVDPLVDYQTEPVAFFTDVLGVPLHTLAWSTNAEYDGHSWDGDPDPFIQAAEALARGEDVGIESGTGTGKTFWLALVVIWFLSVFEDAMVVTAAPKKDQLLLHVWKEIGRHWPRFRKLWPQAVLLTGKVRMRPQREYKELWTATAFVCGVGADEESATKAQGFHAEHMLIITEETPGIDAAIMTAFNNTRTDVHNIQLSVGNPDHQLDELHKFCKIPSTTSYRVSALDHPNVVTGRGIIPGAISDKRVKARALEYGEDSRLYKSRVRGISPAEAPDALIKLAWIEAAQARYDDEELRVGQPGLGVDVANSPNGDLAAIAEGLGACCLTVESFPCEDANLLGSQVYARMGDEIDPAHVGVDSVGVGAGTVNELKRLGVWVQALNAGSKPDETIDWEWVNRGDRSVREEERFYNLRSQRWWYLRRDLQRGHIALPRDPNLAEDLVAPVWWTRGGKIFVESKEDIRPRLGRSTDKGDAVVMWNWVRRRRPERQDHKVERVSAWDPDILRHENHTARLVKAPKIKGRDVSPDLVSF